MCDYEYCLSAYQMGDCFLYLRFIVHVKGSCSFVKKYHGSVLQKCAGDGQALAFAAGKCRAVFADYGLVAIGQFLNELVAVGGFCGSHNVLVRGVLSADIPRIYSTASLFMDSSAVM